MSATARGKGSLLDPPQYPLSIPTCYRSHHFPPYRSSFADLWPRREHPHRSSSNSTCLPNYLDFRSQVHR